MSNIRKWISKFLSNKEDSYLQKIVLKGGGGFFLVKGFSALLSFLLNIVLARHLKAEQYGIYIYAFTWINILAMVGKLGFDRSLVRFVAAYRSQNQLPYLKGIIKVSLINITGVSIAISLLGMVVLYFLKFEEAIQLTAFKISFLLLPLLSLLIVPKSALQGMKKVVQAVIPDIVLRPLLLLITVTIFHFLAQQLLAYEVMLIHVGSAFLALLVGGYLLYRYLPSDLWETEANFQYRYWMTTSLPLLILSGLFLLLNQTDLLIVGAFLSSTETGIYGAVTRIVQLVTMGLLAVNMISGPLISELYNTQQINKLQNLVRFTAYITFFYTIAVGAIILFAGEQVLSLFGKNFNQGYFPLLILMAGHIASAFAGSVMLLLTMTKYQNQAALIVGISFLVNLMLNTLLIPIWGISGAAFSTAISTLLWNVGAIFFVSRKLKINPTILAKPV